MDFDSHIYAERRHEVMESIGEDAVAILVANPPANRSNDTDYRYRASSDIVYLSGFREPQTVLVLAPGHDEGAFALFVRPRDPEKEQWDGRRAGVEGARERYGADAAYPIDELDEHLPDYLEGREVLYYTLGERAEFDARVTDWMHSLRHRRHEPPAAPSSIRDVRDVLHEMRLVKRDEELELIRRAVEITSGAHQRAMAYCRPGMHEYELQAIIEYHFGRHGAAAPAYNTIVGAGDNATILHYIENSDPIGADDVVLIDAGCEYRHYAGDLTRSFPASGTFGAAGRDLYQAVLDVQLRDIEEVRAGVTFQELKDASTRRLIDACLQLGLLSGDVDEIFEDEDQGYRRYIPHGVGHWLGMDVHDVGPYYDDRSESRALEPGMVLTIEPGLYIPADDDEAPAELHGVGVRIEDDVLVTADGRENLSSGCPKAVDEIEALVGSADPDALDL
jgi:Xaa-Pro aminopeptidase